MQGLEPNDEGDITGAGADGQEPLYRMWQLRQEPTRRGLASASCCPPARAT